MTKDQRVARTIAAIHAAAPHAEPSMLGPCLYISYGALSVGRCIVGQVLSQAGIPDGVLAGNRLPDPGDANAAPLVAALYVPRAARVDGEHYLERTDLQVLCEEFDLDVVTLAEAQIVYDNKGIDGVLEAYPLPEQSQPAAVDAVLA